MLNLALGAGVGGGARRGRGGPAAPRNRVPPRLAGSGRIGERLTVDPGVWHGVPAPVLRFRWRRDGVDIPGEFGTSYRPGAADDGRAISCAVEAANAAGTAEAETGAMAATQVPPAARGELADQVFILHSGVQILDASSVYTGPSLTFGVTGDGISIDPATGELSIATDRLRDGVTVTVVARNSGGAAEQTFTLTVAAAAEQRMAPALVAAPSLAGTGTIGTAVTVDPGLWEGTPAPEVALQWLADGAAIAGATAAGYLPVAADDGRALACRVTASNAAGTAAAEAGGLTAAYPAPAVAGALADVTATEGDAPMVVEASAAFAGEALVFAVEGAGATVDAATGRVTIPTAAVLAGAMLTVSATNSGGAAAVGFRVTVAAAVPTGFPRLLGPDEWSPALINPTSTGRQSHVEVADATYRAALAGRPAAGHVLILATDHGSGKPWSTTSMGNNPGLALAGASWSWTSGGRTPIGSTVTWRLYWRDRATETYSEASETKTLLCAPAEEPPLVALPAVLAGPALAGTGKIGAEVAVDPGVWSGEPALAVQWLRDGAAIAGATAPAYVPVAADDRCGLSCRVTGSNAAGSRSVETAALAVTHVAPVAVGELPDEIFDEDTGPQAVPVASAFAGESLAYAVTGSGATIDAATGVVTIATETALADTVTVTAANSGGAASQSFLVTVEAIDPSEVVVVPGQPAPWHETVSTLSALRAAIAARGNEAEPYRIGLAAGNWGHLDLSEIRSVAGAPVVIGSADHGRVGALVDLVNLQNSSRLHLEFLNVDRTGRPRTGGALVDMRGGHDLRIASSMLKGGAWSARSANTDSYLAERGVLIDRSTLRDPERCEVLHCAYGGHLGKGLVAVRGPGHRFVGNVGFEMGGDDIYTGRSDGLIVADNWGARTRRVYVNAEGAADHADFFQVYAGEGTVCHNHTVRGNVLCFDVVFAREGTPMQAIFSGQNPMVDCAIEQNIMWNTSVHGISYASSKYGADYANNLLRNNTCGRVVDGTSSLYYSLIQVGGANAPGSGDNVHANWDATKQPSGGGTTMKVSASTLANQRAYYGGPGATLLRASSFYDFRPLPGMITHWDRADGPPQGAALRYREILEEGRHPGNQPGPVAAVWRAQYDPQSRITA